MKTNKENSQSTKNDDLPRVRSARKEKSDSNKTSDLPSPSPTKRLHKLSAKRDNLENEKVQSPKSK